MIINASSYGSGSCKKAVLYLLQKKDSKGQVREHVQILHGYPEMVAMMADSLSFKNRYSSLVLAWSPKDDPSHAEMKETLQSFADFAFPGMQDRAAWTAVLHKGGEQEGKHIHIIVAKADVETGRSWNPFPPGWDQQFRCWRQLQDLGKRWTSPDELQLDYLERVEDAVGEKELRHQARLYINRWLQASPEIRCRDDLVAALKAGGREFEATKSAISLVVRAVDGKAVRPTRVRLTGPVFEAGWKRDETEISRMAEEARLERLEILQIAVEKARAARLAVNTERILKLGERQGEAMARASEAVSAAIARGVTGQDLVDLWSKAERRRSSIAEEEIDDPAMALDELAQSFPERSERTSVKDYGGEDEQRRLSVLAREVWQARLARERHEREELERWRQANEKRREQRLQEDARREARLRQLAEQSQQQMRLELSFEQEMRRSQKQAAQQLEQLRQDLNINQEKIHEQQHRISNAPSPAEAGGFAPIAAAVQRTGTRLDGATMHPDAHPRIEAAEPRPGAGVDGAGPGDAGAGILSDDEGMAASAFVASEGAAGTAGADCAEGRRLLLSEVDFSSPNESRGARRDAAADVNGDVIVDQRGAGERDSEDRFAEAHDRGSQEELAGHGKFQGRQAEGAFPGESGLPSRFGDLRDSQRGAPGLEGENGESRRQDLGYDVLAGSSVGDRLSGSFAALPEAAAARAIAGDGGTPRRDGREPRPEFYRADQDAAARPLRGAARDADGAAHPARPGRFSDVLDLQQVFLLGEDRRRAHRILPSQTPARTSVAGDSRPGPQDSLRRPTGGDAPVGQPSRLSRPLRLLRELTDGLVAIIAPVLDWAQQQKLKVQEMIDGFTRRMGHARRDLGQAAARIGSANHRLGGHNQELDRQGRNLDWASERLGYQARRIDIELSERHQGNQRFDRALRKSLIRERSLSLRTEEETKIIRQAYDKDSPWRSAPLKLGADPIYAWKCKTNPAEMNDQEVREAYRKTLPQSLLFYLVDTAPRLALEGLSEHLEGGTGIESFAWEEFPAWQRFSSGEKKRLQTDISWGEMLSFLEEEITHRQSQWMEYLEGLDRHSLRRLEKAAGQGDWNEFTEDQLEELRMIFPTYSALESVQKVVRSRIEPEPPSQSQSRGGIGM